MPMTTIDLESEVLRYYNRRILCCIRVRGAALLIGFWDLIIHSFALGLIIYLLKHGKSTNTELISPDGTIFRQIPPWAKDRLQSETPINDLLENKNFQSSNIMLNQILANRNPSRYETRSHVLQVYSDMNLSKGNFAMSLKPQDRFILLLIILSATVLILVNNLGILTNQPSYIVPYLLLKVFNVIVSILSMLGFYAYMPDAKVWLHAQPDFPLKQNLLELNIHTLQLLIFAFLLFVVLAKIYIATIIWYCYGYITALNMARIIPASSRTSRHSRPVTGEMYSPPKYEEAIRTTSQEQEDNAPPPYTPLLQGTA